MVVKKIKLSTFNVNSIRVRISNILKWLKDANPDIVCFQELKCQNHEFDFNIFKELGYEYAVWGQKTYNGVAILSKFPILNSKNIILADKVLTKETAMINGLEAVNIQARCIEATIKIGASDYKVISVYVPNGGGEIKDHENLQDPSKFPLKFAYKISFLRELRDYLAKKQNEKLIIAGDLNIAFQDLDVFDKDYMYNKICFNEHEREELGSLFKIGLIDLFRNCNPLTKSFSWWDYRGNSWKYDKGLRIDYILATPIVADMVEKCYIEDDGIRDIENCSDHCPVSVTLNCYI